MGLGLGLDSGSGLGFKRIFGSGFEVGVKMKDRTCSTVVVFESKHTVAFSRGRLTSALVTPGTL